MNRKKLALSACAAALTGTLALGGTLAYLTSKTNTVENVFTGEDNNLGGRIDERFDEEKAEKYLPGDLIIKEPKLENVDSSVDAWVAVKVDFSRDGEAVNYEEFLKDAAIQFEGVDGFNTTDWAEQKIEGANYKFFVYKKVVAPGQKTNPIFDHVQISKTLQAVFNTKSQIKEAWKEVTKADYEAAEKDGKAVKAIGDGDETQYYVLTSVTKEQVESGETFYLIDENGNKTTTDLKRLPSLKVDVSGYMVQAQNVTYEEAVKQLQDLATK